MIKEQMPLGKLLLEARLNKKLSRAYVCKETKISENSLVRYEKAGIDKNGKYPPAPKLASLCFLLEISPMDALIGSLEGNDYIDKLVRSSVEQIYHHPIYRELHDEHKLSLQQNALMKSIVGRLLGKKPTSSKEREKFKWMLFRLQNLFSEEQEWSSFQWNEYLAPIMPEYLKLRTNGIKEFDNRVFDKGKPALDEDHEKLRQEFKFMSDNEIEELENEINGLNKKEPGKV